MKKPVVWSLTPALIGLGALLIYILACTSFSPDDSKVLYLTVNTKNHMTAVAVYDRKTTQSELLFEPFYLDATNASDDNQPMTRPQWLNDGHDFLAAWLAGSGDSSEPVSINIAVLPFDRRGPARTFLVSNLSKDVNPLFLWPLPVVGSSLFLTSTNGIIRLDLETGQMTSQTNQQPIVVMPSPDNDRLFYLGGANVYENVEEIGMLDPVSLARTPIFKIPEGHASALSLALSRDAKRLAYQVDNETPPVVHLLETGQPARTISLASLGDKTDVFVRQFSPKGDVLYGSFKESTDDVHADYGIVEIPLDGSLIRKTILISGADSGKKDLFASFQIDLSHDGKTVAVESLWLAYDDHPIKADDCALFLVDLSDPQRKITKVPIPMPPHDPPSALR